MNRTRKYIELALKIAGVGLVGLAVSAATYVPDNRLWPGGVVPFEWHEDMPLANRLRVIAAMNIWLDVANVEFVLRDDEADYVLIQNAPGDSGSRSPEIGRAGGRQDLFIRQDLSGITNWGLAHELGHVLGMYHAHQRPDRDDYITVYNSRISESGTGNFPIVSSAIGYPRNAMDYDSVMSYGRCTFSTCGNACSSDLDNCRVIEINDPDNAAAFDANMGQRSYLTRIDELAMSFMYPQPNWRFVELDYAGSDDSGTFHRPYRTLQIAVDSAPQNAVLWIQPASYQQPAGVIDKALLVRAPLGGVVIH